MVCSVLWCCRVFCCCILFDLCLFFFFKQKTAYEMRISDWSSDVCSSDLPDPGASPVRLRRRRRSLGRVDMPVGDILPEITLILTAAAILLVAAFVRQIGRASCRERVCQYV